MYDTLETKKGQEGPPSLATVAAALAKALATMRETLGRPLGRYEIFAAMRGLVGSCHWDAMPVDERVGAERLIWTGSEGTARYLLVTPEGRCYVEGVMPADPSLAVEYLAIRRRFLDAHPVAETPVPGSPDALQARDDYEALTDCIAEDLAGMMHLISTGKTTLH